MRSLLPLVLLVLLCTSSGVGKMMWLIDFEGYSLRNAPAVRTSVGVLHILQVGLEGGGVGRDRDGLGRWERGHVGVIRTVFWGGGSRLGACVCVWGGGAACASSGGSSVKGLVED